MSIEFYRSTCNNIADIVVFNASNNPDGLAYRFINPDGSTHCLTNRELATEVQKLALLIQDITEPGDRVILGARPGLEFVISFYACLKTGNLAVPVFPPVNVAMTERFLHIVEDTKPSLVICDKETITKLKKAISINRFLPQKMKSLAGINEVTNGLLTYLKKHRMKLIASEDRRKQNEVNFSRLTRSSEKIAFLQYTSGSTGHPKGVMISHENLLDNLEIIRNVAQYNTNSHTLCWLPPYHDMGLIAGILEPLYANFPVTLMSTIDFITHPMRWLIYTSQYRCTSTGAPNFAFELCVKNADKVNITHLDLSAIEVIANGAEPINPDTIEKFYQTFEPAGLRRGVILPCYGLAEATVMVTAKSFLQPEKIISIDSVALAKNQIILSESPSSIKLVSSGIPQMIVKIVNEKTNKLCQDDEVGEIWVQGKSVAKGYFLNDEATRTTFANELVAQSPLFLRTGDLGFIHENELFVCGRIKDLIIIRGQNFYPQDIENQVSLSVNEIRRGCVIAFSEQEEGVEKVSVVCEIKSKEEQAVYAKVAEKIQRETCKKFQFSIDHIYLIPPRSIPKTTSGKLQRCLCAAKIANNQLTILYHYQHKSSLSPNVTLENISKANKLDVKILSEKTDNQLTANLENWFSLWLEKEKKIKKEKIQFEKPLYYYGVDSIDLGSLMRDCELYLNKEITVSDLNNELNINEFIKNIILNLPGV